jgi:hypothetical protein
MLAGKVNENVPIMKKTFVSHDLANEGFAFLESGIYSFQLGT